MIVGDRKSLEEIVSTIKEFKHVLILGCGTCVTVCLTGGDKEAKILARDLSAPGLYKNDEPPCFVTDTIERQCEQI